MAVEVTLIYTIQTFVAQEGIEPPAQGYEPYMLPLHHRAILNKNWTDYYRYRHHLHLRLGNTFE